MAQMRKSKRIRYMGERRKTTQGVGCNEQVAWVGKKMSC